MLATLADAANPLTISEIGDTIGVDQPRASRLVQQAVKLGLAQREADQDDARRIRVALTVEGEAIVRRFRGDRLDTVRAALEDFSPAERAQLATLLTKFAEAWPDTPRRPH
ncbi:MAG: MarR family winged helix-turn-helix transcriptional regulator [Pseudoclavibacter sp.]